MLLARFGPTFRQYVFNCPAISTGLMKVLLPYTTLVGYDWFLVFLSVRSPISFHVDLKLLLHLLKCD